MELTVLSNTYVGDIWELNPLRAENNLQHVGAVDWQDYISLKNQELVKRQSRYLRKIIEETSGYDNVYYEICNEPGGGFAGHASPADVDAWQSEMARVMREEMKRLNKPHLLSGQQAFTYGGNNSFPMQPLRVITSTLRTTTRCPIRSLTAKYSRWVTSCRRS